MNNIIDCFYIYEKAPHRKDYVATVHKIELPYKLREGDKLYRLSYEGRGSSMGYDATILSITDKFIKITSHWNEGEEILVPFVEDSNDKRILEFSPFPPFREGINKKNFEKIITKSMDDFVIMKSVSKHSFYADEEIKKQKQYVRNFKNINPVIEEEMKLEDTEEGQYRFAI